MGRFSWRFIANTGVSLRCFAFFWQCLDVVCILQQMLLLMLHGQGFSSIIGNGFLDLRSLVQLLIYIYCSVLRCFTGRVFPSLMAWGYWIIDPLWSVARCFMSMAQCYDFYLQMGLPSSDYWIIDPLCIDGI